jgi:hypothetical protein
MKTMKKINLILGLLLLPMFIEAATGTNSDGITFSGETINTDNDWALEYISTSIYDNDDEGDFRWRAGANINENVDWKSNGTMGDISSAIKIYAVAEGNCYGGSNDQCGAFMELKQTSTDGVQNDSTMTMRAKTVSISGKVNLGTVGGSGTSVTDLGAYVTATQATAASNTTNIATNTTGIATNTTNIATNTTNIATNTTNIATNTTNIATNTTGIATNTTNIATNTTNIATNTTGIATNTTNIATNTTNIATNTTGIATNKTDIASNSSLIATNTATLSALIGVNGTGIQSLASSFSSFQEDTNRNFIALTGNMYEGLAEVTAISNVAYASSGWRASAGYGDYKSKSATAVGISYAGEKYKFKFSKSGDATGFGISYDF